MTMTAPVQLHNLIAGQWLPGSGAPLHSINPADPRLVVAEGRSAESSHLEAAVAAAADAQAAWAATPIHQRGAVLMDAAAVVERNAASWGFELAAEEGKTKAEGIGEVRRAAQILRYYGNEGDRQTGEIFASPRAGEQILVTRKPVGVVGVITPFNFPIAIPAWKIAPALVYGNTVVWKPASAVPLLAMRLAHALTCAGLPAGVLNLLIGGSYLGDSLVDHEGVDAITFTGSTGVGRRIAAAAAARGVPVQAEMGGKNAAIVLDDADIELALEQVMFGAFRSTGQKCTATSRLIVTDGIAERFLEALRTRADALIVGDPTDDSTEMGPVVSDSAFQSISAGIETATAQGATLLAGGRPYTEAPLSDGYFIAPTIVELDSPARRRVDRGTVRPRTSGATRRRCRAGVRAGQRQRIRALGSAVHPGPHPGAAGRRADRRRRPARQLRIRRRRPACAVRRRKEERPGSQGAGQRGKGILHPHHHGVHARWSGARMNPGALDGLVVVDFSRVLAGPYATMMLGDFGADVIKIERPQVGDDTREWGPPYDSEGVATYFNAVNRNKRSVVLDLTDPGRPTTRPRAGGHRRHRGGELPRRNDGEIRSRLRRPCVHRSPTSSTARSPGSAATEVPPCPATTCWCRRSVD